MPIARNYYNILLIPSGAGIRKLVLLLQEIIVKSGTQRLRIILGQVLGFLFIIGLIWIVELTPLLTYFGGSEHVADYNEAILESCGVLIVAIPFIVLTLHYSKRLFYLENFLRVCSWCRRVENDNKWLTQEKYFDAKFKTRTSHGICEDCLLREREKLLEFNAAADLE